MKTHPCPESPELGYSPIQRWLREQIFREFELASTGPGRPTVEVLVVDEPRPTCGTCPLFQVETPRYVPEGCNSWIDNYGRTRLVGDGRCRHSPPPGLADCLPIVEPSHWCGQHPDMAAWIAGRKASVA